MFILYILYLEALSGGLSWVFSIKINQKHEMNNKTIKSRSGYIDLVNMKDTSYLRKMEICYAEVNELLED